MAEDPRDITDQEFYLDDLRQSRRLAEELERAEREIKDLLAERAVLRGRLAEAINGCAFDIPAPVGRAMVLLKTEALAALDRILPEER